MRQSTNEFLMFSTTHFIVLVFVMCGCMLLYLFRDALRRFTYQNQVEKAFAISLLVFELLYHGWLIQTDAWQLSHALPLELCSITIVLSAALLWTGNRFLYDIVYFAGIAGTLQALLTPVLAIGFPHFRFFHFFYVHAGILWTACYFTLVIGYRPTFSGVLKTMLALNILLPVILVMNHLVDGNYMFLRTKPAGGSLLDYLGPYPWYIIVMELTAFCFFCLLWLIGRKRASR